MDMKSEAKFYMQISLPVGACVIKICIGIFSGKRARMCNFVMLTFHHVSITLNKTANTAFHVPKPVQLLHAFTRQQQQQFFISLIYKKFFTLILLLFKLQNYEYRLSIITIRAKKKLENRYGKFRKKRENFS